MQQKNSWKLFFIFHLRITCFIEDFQKIVPIHFLEAVVQTFSVKKVLLEISQNSQENSSATVSFLIKLQAWACNFIKKRDSDTDVFL